MLDIVFMYIAFVILYLASDITLLLLYFCLVHSCKTKLGPGYTKHPVDKYRKISFCNICVIGTYNTYILCRPILFLQTTYRSNPGENIHFLLQTVRNTFR